MHYKYHFVCLYTDNINIINQYDILQTPIFETVIAITHYSTVNTFTNTLQINYICLQ